MAGRSYQFPVYQIDFSAVAAGKRVAATKRRIRWRFGFPNLKAIEEGRTGTDCRGEEHEVVIIWSVTSGKRQILMDGREIHYSANRVGILDFSWNTKGNHVLKVVCHAAPPMTATPGFRQYDLLIDGQSFFHMPKVYELGIKGGSAVDRRVPGRQPPYGETAASPRLSYDPSYNEPVHAPRDAQEEDEELQAAIRASLEESKKHLNENGQQPDVLSNGGGAGGGGGDLLDFAGPSSASSVPALMSDPSMNSFTSAPQPIAAAAPQPGYDTTGYGAPPPQQQQQPQLALPPTQYGAPPPRPPQQQQFAALPPSQSAGSQSTFQPAPPAYGSPPPQQQYQQQVPMPPAPTHNQFTPPPTYGSAAGGDSFAGYSIDDPFAPKAPTHNDVANGILKAYGGMSPTSVSSQSHGRYQPGQPFMQLNGSAPPQGPPPQANGEEQTLSMNGGYAQTPNLSMNALTTTEEEPQNPFDAALKKLVNIDHIDEPAEEQLKLTMKKQEDERAKKNRHKSAPLPPAASRIVGSGATLGQISQVKPPTKTECVMQPPPGLFQDEAAMAGSMVVYGQGPPPLQPRGFGVVHMQGQYAAQQQVMYARPRQQQYGYR